MFRAPHDLDAQYGRKLLETTMNPSITSTGFRGLIATAIFGFLGLGLCSVAAAVPSDESRTVKFADLNMSNPSSAHVLYRRIRAAAQVVCSYYFFATDTDKARCVRDVTADTVTRINQPALSTVYNANNKTSVPGSLVSRSR
jgi:UrcA family protein